MSYWIIKDRGKMAHKTGIYFVGWTKDPCSSWSSDRNESMIFSSKKEAFAFLRTFKGKEHIYAKWGAKLRFVVMKINAPRPKELPEIGSPSRALRVERRRGGEDIGRPGNPANEKVGIAA